MPDGSENFSISVVDAIASLPTGAWDRCAGSADPFVSHAFLLSLEESGSVCPEAGWQPQHVLAKDAAGEILGCAPLYLKGNSTGEYVFDHGWADAYQRAGGRYYPKLLSAVPFTPVTGPRLLVRNDLSAEMQSEVRTLLIRGLVHHAKALKVSSLHVNFLNETDAALLEAKGFIPRVHLQYHWQNRGQNRGQNKGYADFDSFLGALASRKRKAIRKERREVESAGLNIERLSGDAIKPRHWDAMYGFYQNTGQRKWGQPYLNREFFTLLGERMADRVLMVVASEGENIIAGALNLIGTDALYGRYWGCNTHVQFLHFELCYYQAIEAAIELGLERIEAGAQGEHKIARGYLAQLTRSAHWIADPGFADAISDFTRHEARAIDQEKTLLDAESPYRQT